MEIIPKSDFSIWIAFTFILLGITVLWIKLNNIEKILKIEDPLQKQIKYVKEDEKKL